MAFRKSIPLSFFLVLSMTVGSYSQTNGVLKQIESDFIKILGATKAPGFAVAIVKDDKILYSQGFGYRDYENRLPMDANTLLPIGSTTKAFTCALLGLFREEGELNFADSPIQHVSELRFHTDQLDKDLTVRDLMTHMTGIPRHDESWYLFPTHSKDSLIQRIQFQEPFTGLRQKWHYNNFMFMIQGVIAERISGHSWEDNIKRYFFEPLGMSRSNSSISKLQESENRALGYDLKQDTLIQSVEYYDLGGLGPAGSINSTVNDMAKWVQVWLNKGSYGGKQILPESYILEAMASQAVTSASLPDQEHPDMFLSNYGYGWFISSYRGHYRVQHEGNIDGFSANVTFFPSDGIGIVVLVNQGGSEVTSLVRNTIADRMLNTKRTDWVKDFESSVEGRKGAKEQAISRTTAKKSSRQLDFYTGSYMNQGYGQFEVMPQKDSLFVQFKLKRYYLEYRDKHTFLPFEVTESGLRASGLPPFHFQPKSDGKEIGSVEIHLEQMLDHPIEFKKNPSAN